tara:strand:+ start:1198 stop:1425 length:228 start_codon:yes stop_codon:yes gene_type:complete
MSTFHTVGNKTARFRPSNGSGAGVRRLIFTNKATGGHDNHYVVGAGVGAKSVAVKQALKKRANNKADGTPCCSGK